VSLEWQFRTLQTRQVGAASHKRNSGESVDVSNWINLGIFLLTGVALWFAINQAKEAQTQRLAADKASIAAGKHEAAALDAASRSAAASERLAGEQGRAADELEKQTALAIRAARPTELWQFVTYDSPKTDQRWRIENSTGEKAGSVTISGPHVGSWIRPEHDVVDSVKPGEAFHFTFIHRLSSPTDSTVTVTWSPAYGAAQEKFTRHIG
jgi:hypothetical protein